MSFWGKIFGTDKAVNNLVDKDNGLLAQAGAWVGNLNYTEEEKAEANERTRDWGLKQLDALAPFKVVQRILAFAATVLWVFVGINVVGAVWIKAYTEGRIDVVEPMIQFAMSDYVFWPVVTVYALYFSGGVVDSIKRKIGK